MNVIDVHVVALLSTAALILTLVRVFVISVWRRACVPVDQQCIPADGRTLVVMRHDGHDEEDEETGDGETMPGS
jgi:hypothetical protein